VEARLTPDLTCDRTAQAEKGDASQDLAMNPISLFQTVRAGRQASACRIDPASARRRQPSAGTLRPGRADSSAANTNVALARCHWAPARQGLGCTAPPSFGSTKLATLTAIFGYP
jgi:hypothetical protein